MKTLKELKEKCTLIATFIQPAYVENEGYEAKILEKVIKAYLFYNKENYYLYSNTPKWEIEEYDNIYDAIYRLNKFIYNVECL